MTRTVPGAEYRAIARRHHKRVCVICGALDPLDVHHKNGNHADNAPGNLEWRCKPHHLQAHGKRMQTATPIIFASKADAKRALPTFKGTGIAYRVVERAATPDHRRRGGLAKALLVLAVLIVILAVL